MSQAYSIRQLRRKGESIASIARIMDVSRNTVYKYLDEDDFSPRIPVRKGRPRELDAYRDIIVSWLEDDRGQWRKQRHTAHRIWERLRDECGYAGGESTVRAYVRELKSGMGDAERGYLDQEWPPGEAQADFGEADFDIYGVRRRLSYFVLSFPYSNIGIAQVFGGENSECVCQGLKDIFGYIGGVPTRIVFDNATGVGRRVSDMVRTAELFSAFAAHYGFDYSFCNPNSGHEKGNVEGKVRYIRSNLFVPTPRIYDLDRYNGRLPDMCMALSKEHYAKGEDEAQLFVEDRFALLGLPRKPFDAVRYVRAKADKWGKVHLDGRHAYSADPALAGRELICALGAHRVAVYTPEGEYVCEHARAYGAAPTDTADPASQLALLCARTGGWVNSRVRFALPDGLRGHMDSLSRADLRAELRIMRDMAADYGWDATVAAMESSLESLGRVDKAGMEIACARMEGGTIEYDEPVDLSIYDAALAKAAV